MGLYVENFDKATEFLKEAERLCKVRVIDYNSSEKVHVNLAMQTPDEQGLSLFDDLCRYIT